MVEMPMRDAEKDAHMPKGFRFACMETRRDLGESVWSIKNRKSGLVLGSIVPRRAMRYRGSGGSGWKRG